MFSEYSKMSSRKLIISIEAGGWGDAVMPVVSPEGTAGEWFEDPYGEVGYTFSGPGQSPGRFPTSDKY
jgi:hypothetical protein